MSTSLKTFDFIPEGERSMYSTAFDAITQLELWPFMKNFEGKSFMFDSYPEVDRISERINKLGYGLHSGASFGCMMRTMEYIGKNGFNMFEEDYKKGVQTKEEYILFQAEQRRIREEHTRIWAEQKHNWN